jgi:uncharacterized protein (TIGR02145 family)
MNTMKQLNKMKVGKSFLFASLLFVSGIINAQMGIGTNSPAASAQLDVTATNKGFLPPRLTQEQRSAIANPVPGLMIWCRDCGIVGELQVFNGASWSNMAGGTPQPVLSKTVKIGTQEWITKNLDVVTFRNGDTIPEIRDAAAWASTNQPAWCYYNNDPGLGAIYGKLYNRYAVTDARGLAPAGWHIANENFDPFFTDTGGDWMTLMNNAGENTEIMATTLWTNPGTNSTGFTALPAGYRTKDGSFGALGDEAHWWGTSVFLEYDPHDYPANNFFTSWGIGNFSNFIPVYEITPSGDPYDPYIYTSQHNERYGFSVRCVKD